MNGIRTGHLITTFAIALAVTGCAGNSKELGTSQDDSPADLYVQIAAEYYRLGEIEAALKNVQKGLEEDNKNAQAHNVIATIYQRIEQDELAEKHFRTALRLAPQDPYILTAWGNYQCEKRNYAEAEDQYKKALANPLFSAPWVTETRAGMCAHSAGQTGKSEQYLRRALSVNPRYDPALLEMAELDYSAGRYKSARSYLDRYFKTRGYTPKSLLLAVRVERRLGSTKRARTYEKLLRKSYPDAPEIISL